MSDDNTDVQGLIERLRARLPYLRNKADIAYFAEAADALAAMAAENARIEPDATTARMMREEAQRLGYSSILEALEDVARLKALVEEAKAACERITKAPPLGPHSAAPIARDFLAKLGGSDAEVR